jgi:pyruvate dehydrogenase E2 component (dihydrolipoamide acetyltransferase)
VDESGGAVAEESAPAVTPIRSNGHPPAPAEAEPHAVSAPTIAPRPAQIPPGIVATPLARSMAVQAGLDLSSIRGSGPRGRIVRADVLAALGLESKAEDARPARTTAAPATRPPSSASAPFDEVPHSRVRRVIAERLGESKRTIPHFYLEASCRVDALLKLREEIAASQGEGIKPSINDFALRAAALALKKVPEANASWTDAATRRYRRIDLAFAVATEGGLVAPVIRDADRKGLAELGEEVRDLATRAREGRLRLEELDGGTFTVSNLGMFGVDAIYAIVNPPQAAILGLGAAQPRPVAEDGSVVVATVMSCTLSADHRVLDGATGARFLGAFKGLIERPLNMIL